MKYLLVISLILILSTASFGMGIELQHDCFDAWSIVHLFGSATLYGIGNGYWNPQAGIKMAVGWTITWEVLDLAYSHVYNDCPDWMGSIFDPTGFCWGDVAMGVIGMGMAWYINERIIK